MGATHDFDAARKARVGDPFRFTLAGESFTVPRDGGVMPILDMAKAMTAISGLGDEAGAGDIATIGAAVGAFEEFIVALVAPDEQGRFHKALRRYNPDLDELTDIASVLIREVSGRPLEQPSASQASSSETSPASKVVSLSAGTVNGVPVAQAAPDAAPAGTIIPSSV